MLRVTILSRLRSCAIVVRACIDLRRLGVDEVRSQHPTSDTNVTKIVSDRDDLRLTAQAIQLATRGWVGGVMDHYN